jgi:Rod binding domain-containing protein
MAGVGALPAEIPGATDPRLKPAAHEFEACLMKEFLQPLQHDALFSDDKNDDSGEGSGSALLSFGSAALAKAISERGGFGIADRIIGHFHGGIRAAAQNNRKI